MLTPEQIKNEIQKVTPFQQKAVMASFQNLKVSWDLKFTSIDQIGDEKSFLVTSESTTTFLWVYFYVDIEKHPEFKVIHKGEVFHVEGLIGSVQGVHQIDLKDCIFSFKNTSNNLVNDITGKSPGVYFEAKGDINLDGGQILVGNNNTISFASEKDIKYKNTEILQTKKKGNWFTMENPIVYVIVILFIAGVVFFSDEMGFHLKV